MSDEEIMEKLRRCFLFQINGGLRTEDGILSFCPHPYFCVNTVLDWVCVRQYLRALHSGAVLIYMLQSPIG